MSHGHWKRAVMPAVTGMVLSLQSVTAGGEPATGDGLKLATFACDVTPPIGSPLCGGLVKPASAVDDPLLAKGIVLRDETGTYVLCALDFCALRGGAYDLFREKIAAAVNTPPSRVAVQCVHPHDAPYTDPRTQELLAQTKDPPSHADLDYLRASAEKVAAAARGADNFQPVTQVGTSKARVDRVASNRRVLQADGTIGVRYSACRNPALKAAPEGLIDPELRTVTFFNGSKPLVHMHYYATHPQSHYGKGRVSRDFPGIARERLQEQTGVFQMYFTGCAGNVTAGKYNEGTPEQRYELADRLQAAMTESIGRIDRRPVRPIVWRVRDVRFPRRHDAAFQEKSLRARLENPQASATQRILAGLALAALDRLASNRPLELTCLSIGPVHILHLPGESFIQFQLLAQQCRPDEFVAVAAYGDDFTGYICNEKAFEQGGYEPTQSMVAPVSEHYMTAAITDLLADQMPSAPRIREVRRIWNAAPHCAFTDLVRYKGRWLCAFREGAGHVSEEASIRVIASTNGEKWESAALLTEAGADLRDAKLCTAPDGRLMLMGGRRTWPPKYPRSMQSWAAFSEDGSQWTKPQEVAGDDEWLWRVTWHDGAGYGIAYGSSNPDKESDDWYSRLYRTRDGLNYEQVAAFRDYPGLTEATLGFGGDGTMYCIHRRDAGTRTALLGTGKPPYADWTWRDTGFHLGGPDLVQYQGQWYAGGRWMVGGAKTVLARVDFERGTLEPVVELPSGGDNSYPGFVVDGRDLWTSYYSSHEGSAAIYLAWIEMP